MTIYFVVERYQHWQEHIEEYGLNINGDTGGEGGWIVQTYFELKKKGFDVELADGYVLDEICIVYYDYIMNSVPPSECYVVSIRADRNRTFICDLEIIQSPYSAETGKELFIQFWTESDIKQRDKDRRSRIENIGYFGEEKYIPEEFKSESFKKALEKRGVSFVVKSAYPSWLDYSDIDLVFAIRTGCQYYLNSKPASKLLNAWMAGCPAVVGGEPIFDFYIKSDLDFFIATTPDDVIDIVDRLLEEPSLYQEMVTNGFNRYSSFDREYVLDSWINLINSLGTCYAEWKKTPYIIKKIKRSYCGIKRYIRGALYETAGGVMQGRTVSNIGLYRRTLWFLFDRFAWYEYKNIYNHFKN